MIRPACGALIILFGIGAAPVAAQRGDITTAAAAVYRRYAAHVVRIEVVEQSSAAKRWAVALAFGAAIDSMTVATQVIDHREFSATSTVAARLEPLPASWIPAQGPDNFNFFTEVRRLRTRVDAMAGERP